MSGFAKFLVGAAVTSLLAWGSNAVSGEKTIDGIQTNAQAAFAGLDLGGTGSVAMQRDPLARIAVVSGAYDDATQEKIRTTLLNVPGVAKVRFADDDDEAASDLSGASTSDSAMSTGAATPAASEEEVADCQTGVDSLMDGQTINFASGSAAIAADSAKLIDNLASSVKGCDGMTIAIGGHTDATGSDDANQRLSQARANAVAAALIDRGVRAESITAVGYGSTQPKAEGSGAAANAENRRIEFTLSAAGVTTSGGE